MTAARAAAIIGTGMAVPSRVVTNVDLSKTIDTSDEWIVTRTGIKERRVAADGEATSDLGYLAGRQALENAKVKPEELDLIIAATMTPDMLCPATACLIQKKLGAKNAGGFDLEAACSGFIYGLSMARGAILGGEAKTILLVGAETVSRIIDWQDRRTCVLFGDAAGAVVMRAETDGRGVLGTLLGADGGGAELIEVPAGGSRLPASRETVDGRQHFLRMRGQDVFKAGVRSMTQAVIQVLAKCGLKKEDISLLIPHQANKRIIDAIANSLDFPKEKILINLDRFGNTSAATIPVALHEAITEGRVKSGDLVCTVAFGGGLTWGSAVIRI